MKNAYTYTIERYVDGQWRTIRRSRMHSTRDPESFARGLLELWLIRQRRPPSGRVVVTGGRRGDKGGVAAFVRVRAYLDRIDHETALPQRPVAAAYLTPLAGADIGAVA